MKIIEKLGTGKFRITTFIDGDDSHVLEIDFNPIIEKLSDRDKSYDYTLLHWQGAPKGNREWGIYDPAKDVYICSVFDDWRFTNYGGFKLIMLDDVTTATKPSAVIYFVGSLPVERDINISSSEGIALESLEPNTYSPPPFQPQNSEQVEG